MRRVALSGAAFDTPPRQPTTVAQCRAVTITDVEQLGGAVVNQLADLFDEDTAPRRRRIIRAA